MRSVFCILNVRTQVTSIKVPLAMDAFLKDSRAMSEPPALPPDAPAPASQPAPRRLVERRDGRRARLHLPPGLAAALLSRALARLAAHGFLKACFSGSVRWFEVV